jgi:hypothetical protein
MEKDLAIAEITVTLARAGEAVAGVARLEQPSEHQQQDQQRHGSSLSFEARPGHHRGVKKGHGQVASPFETATAISPFSPPFHYLPPPSESNRVPLSRSIYGGQH